MRYGKFLTKGSKIALCSPSFGSPLDPYYSRLKSAIDTFRNLGFQVIEGDYIWSLDRIRSTSKENRAKEFMDLYLDPNVDFIYSVAGGEVMMEIIPLIDFDKIKNAPPKFFAGFSDNTNISFLLATLCDTASIYYDCAGTFGMKPWHYSTKRGMDILMGNNIVQESFDKYQVIDLKWEENNPLASLNCTEDDVWHNLKNEEKLEIKGRMLGGCLDILKMYCGTRFDKVSDFAEKYKNDGILWYLEACDLSSLDVYRTLFQLREAGWFKYAKGFVFGRPNNNSNPFSYTHHDAIKEALGDLNLPIITDADFGHIPPAFVIINGAIGKFTSEKGKGTLSTSLI